jgi:hypothetical protein
MEGVDLQRAKRIMRLRWDAGALRRARQISDVPCADR